MKNKRFSRRCFVVLMVFVMMVGFLPTAALAVDGINTPPTVVSGQETQTGIAIPASGDGATPAIPYAANLGHWFTDADNDPLTYSVVSAAYGTDDVSPYVSISDGTITYTPAAAQADGTVTIVVRASDGTADSAGNVTVTVTVNPVPTDTEDNQPPTGGPIEEPAAAKAPVRVESLAVMTGEPGALATAEAVEAGNTYTVRVTVANSGNTDAAGLGVALYEERSEEVHALVYSQSLDNLAADAEATLDFAWTPQTAGEYTLKAVLTAGGEEKDAEELAVSVAGLFRMMALADDSVTAYVFIENTTVTQQGKTNFRAHVDSILPMREVTVTSSDVAAINRALETKLGLPEHSLSDTDFMAIHFLIKAMMDLGESDPYSHLTLVKETASGSCIFGSTPSVAPAAADDYYISALALGGTTVTGLNQQVTTYMSAAAQTGNKWFSITSPMQCMVIASDNTASKDGALLETPVSDGDILGLTREVRAFNTAADNNISPYYKTSSPSQSAAVDDALSLTFQLQSVAGGAATDVNDLTEGSTKETKLYKYSEASKTYSEIANYDGPGLYVTRICTSGYYNNSTSQGDAVRAYLASAYSMITLVGDSYAPIIRYKIGGTGDEITASLSQIGTWAPSSSYPNNKVYLVSLPYNAHISSYSVTGAGYDCSSNLIYGTNTSNVNNITDFTTLTSYYVSGDQFIGTNLTSSQHYKKNFLAKLDNVSATTALIPTASDLVGYCLRIIVKSGETVVHYPAVVVQITTSPPSATVDTEELSSLVDSVTGEHDDDFYHENDRWNGSETSPNGFWADMQPYLTTAQGYISTPPASQQTVDTAAAGLAAAIDKLIPATNVNATLLHETVLLAGTKTQSAYAAYSWSALQAQVAAANAMLGALYDAGGNPTALNIAVAGAGDPAGAIYQTDVDAQTAALTAAIAALYTQAAYDQALGKAEDAQSATAALDMYIDANLAGTSFTTGSWTALNAARGTAESLASSLDTTSYPALLDMADKYKAYHDACVYGLVDLDGEVTITLAVDSADVPTPVYFGQMSIDLDDYTADDFSQFDRFDYDYVAYNEILSKTPTVFHAIVKMWDALGIVQTDAYEDRTGGYILAFPADVYGNYNALIRNLFPNDKQSAYSDYYQIYIDGFSMDSRNAYAVLYDGAAVTLSKIRHPGYVNMSGGPLTIPQSAYEDKVLFLRYKDHGPGDAVSIAAGERLYLAVEGTDPLPHLYTGVYNGVMDMDIYVSSYDPATGAVGMAEPAGVVSLPSGTFSLSLDHEGCYIVSAYDGRNLSVTSDMWTGDGGVLSVTPYIIVNVTTPNAGTLAAAKAAMKASLDAAYGAAQSTDFTTEDYEAFTQAYQTGLANIEAAQTYGAAVDGKDAALAAMAAVARIDHAAIMANVRTLLSHVPGLDETWSKADSEFYAIKLAYEAYAALNEYQRGLLTGAEQRIVDRILAVYGTDGSTMPEAREYTLTINVVNPGGGTFDYFRKYDPLNPGSSTNITVTNHTAAIRQGDYVGLRYILNDNYDEYCAVFAIDGHATVRRFWIPEEETLWYDEDIVKITGIGSFQFSTSCSFTMPGKDAVLTVAFVENDEADPLASERETAVGAITTAFSSYAKNNYTTEGWTAITEAKNAGLNAIEAATTAVAVTEAKNTAIAAMAAAAAAGLKGGAGSGVDIVSADSVFNAGTPVGTVDVYIENTTFPGGAFTGTIVTKQNYQFGVNDTMMTVALRALAEDGFGWSASNNVGVNDYSIAYLAKIAKDGRELGEFSGEPGSGWMGTLNDWFTNYGFQAFSAANGKLHDGDEIRIMFTQNLGEDLGGTWYNSNTTLKALQISGGNIVPAFASGAAPGGSYEYALVIPGSNASVKVTPTAANKNYLVKTYLNEKNMTGTEGNSFYKRTESIPVRAGDVIYIGCGECSWPSMNNQETENRSYTGTWYELHVISPDNGASYVNGVIGRLPAAGKITNGNYESYRAPIGYIRTVYGVLNASEKAKVDLTKLTEAEAKLTFFDQIQNVKNLLAAIPKASTITKSNMKTIAAQVRAAETAYKALTDDQKLYITVGIVANYNAALAKLTELGAFDSGDSAPAPITGSAGPPEVITSTLAPKVTASNGVAAVSVSASDITAAIKDVKEKGSTAILIAPEITGEASKVSVGIPKESLSSIASETEAGLTVQTPVGSLTIPNNVLTTIADQAAGGTVTVSLASVDTTTLTPAQQEAVGDNPVYDINVLSGGANISSFAGGSITISLPYTLKEGEDPASVTVWYLNDAGELEQVACTYDPETGMAIFTTNHLTYYVVGYEEAAVPPAVPGQTFSDVSPTDWYYDSVTFAVYKGLMNGTSAATFSPNDPMTRAMLVTVLHRLEGSPTVTGTNSFSDVRDNEWYTEAVAWASAGGITTGYGNNLFGTNDSITRQQLATIIYRYAEYKSYDVTKRTDLAAYTDAAEIGPWAIDALQWANAEKLLTGRTETTLAPGGSATRAEVAAILMRFVEGVVR